MHVVVDGKVGSILKDEERGTGRSGCCSLGTYTGGVLGVKLCDELVVDRALPILRLKDR